MILRQAQDERMLVHFPFPFVLSLSKPVLSGWLAQPAEGDASPKPSCKEAF